MNEETKKFPAQYVVYWPGQKTFACETHKDKLLYLASAMGMPAPDYEPLCIVAECKNCINESKKVKP
jgi:hypothetical protein